MKPNFIEALEEFLTARDTLHKVNKDRNNSQWEKRNAADWYDHAAHKLEEAHKISLMDLISGDSDAT